MKYLILLSIAIILIGCSESPTQNSVTQNQTDNIIKTSPPLVTVIITDMNDLTFTYHSSEVTYEYIQQGGYIVHIFTEGCGYTYPIENVKYFVILPE